MQKSSLQEESEFSDYLVKNSQKSSVFSEKVKFRILSNSNEENKSSNKSMSNIKFYYLLLQVKKRLNQV